MQTNLTSASKIHLAVEDYLNLIDENSTRIEINTNKFILDRPKSPVPVSPKKHPDLSLDGNIPSPTNSLLFAAGVDASLSVKVLDECWESRELVNQFYHNLLTQFVMVYADPTQSPLTTIDKMLKKLGTSPDASDEGGDQVVAELLGGRQACINRIVNALDGKKRKNVGTMTAPNGKVLGGAVFYNKGSAEEDFERKSDLTLRLLLEDAYGPYRNNLLRALLIIFKRMLETGEQPITDKKSSDYLGRLMTRLVTKSSFEGYCLYYDAKERENRMHVTENVIFSGKAVLPDIQSLNQANADKDAMRLQFLNNCNMDIDAFSVVAKDNRIIGSNPVDGIINFDPDPVRDPSNFKKLTSDPFCWIAERDKKYAAFIELPIGCGAFGGNINDFASGLANTMRDKAITISKNITKLYLATMPSNYEKLSATFTPLNSVDEGKKIKGTRFKVKLDVLFHNDTVIQYSAAVCSTNDKDAFSHNNILENANKKNNVHVECSFSGVKNVKLHCELLFSALEENDFVNIKDVHIVAENLNQFNEIVRHLEEMQKRKQTKDYFNDLFLEIEDNKNVSWEIKSVRLQKIIDTYKLKLVLTQDQRDAFRDYILTHADNAKQPSHEHQQAQINMAIAGIKRYLHRNLSKSAGYRANAYLLELSSPHRSLFYKQVLLYSMLSARDGKTLNSDVMFGKLILKSLKQQLNEHCFIAQAQNELEKLIFKIVVAANESNKGSFPVSLIYEIEHFEKRLNNSKELIPDIFNQLQRMDVGENVTLKKMNEIATSYQGNKHRHNYLSKVQAIADNYCANSQSILTKLGMFNQDKDNPEVALCIHTISQLENNRKFNPKIKSYSQAIIAQQKREFLSIMANEFDRLASESGFLDFIGFRKKADMKISALKDLAKAVRESDVNKSLSTVLDENVALVKLLKERRGGKKSTLAIKFSEIENSVITKDPQKILNNLQKPEMGKLIIS